MNDDRNLPELPKGCVDASAMIAADVSFAGDCWIGPDVVVGSGCKIGPGVTIGMAGPEGYCGDVQIGKNVWIGPQAYIEPGVTIGDNCVIGSYALIRHGTKVGQGSRIGARCTIMDSVFIDEYANLIAEIYVCEYAHIGKHCQISPGVTLVNDRYPPTALDVVGPVVGDCAIIGVKSVIWPGVKIGYHGMVASLSEVKDDVLDYVLVRGNPAKPICDVRQIRMKHKGQWVYPYPWMRMNSPDEDLSKPGY